MDTRDKHLTGLAELVEIMALNHIHTENTAMHNALMADPELMPLKGEAGYVPAVSMDELEAALAG